jgi:hypothetical protein
VAMRKGKGQLRIGSSSMLLRTVSKETLPMSRKLSSGGGSSRSMSSLISRNDGVREIPGLKLGATEGGSSTRRVALDRAGGGDRGASATTLERSPGGSEGTLSITPELAPDDVDGRERRRGGGGSPCGVFRDWMDMERTLCPRELIPV